MPLMPTTPGAGTMPAPGRSASATGQPGPNNLGQRSYNAPPNSAAAPGSDIGNQIRTDWYQKKALIEAKKKMFFGQMADTTSMPKHYGKTIVKYHYLPLLDDANINDQGIDANGNIMAGEYTVEVRLNPATPLPTVADAAGDITGALGNRYANNAGPVYADGSHFKVFGMGIDEATATADVVSKLARAGIAVVATDVASLTTAMATMYPGSKVVDHGLHLTGNLYGSSKDVGTIAGKMPALSEFGGRENRVGFKRIELRGSLQKFGFFDEYTQESLDFDTDAELSMHINREMVNGAAEITEDALQIDLLNAAGVIRYGGSAMSTAALIGATTAGGTDASVMNWNDLLRLSIELDQNRCSKDTKIITGSRMVDTKVIGATRYMFIGSELLITMRNMRDNFGNPAFIPIEAYGAAGTIATGEVGSIGLFRLVVVPEMMHWAGAGGDASGTKNPDGYYETAGKFDVFPMLVIGNESFTTIGFQTDGKTVKFKIIHRKPGNKTADRMDPYGETGFMSIKWYYGFMVLRPERIALCKVVAKM